jgi:uncharacterized pyridoxal phosphate-containing UPF0001 family protein
VTTDVVRENLARVRERIDAAAQRAGRRREEITLIGVSKTHPVEAIRSALAGFWREPSAGVGREAR